MPYENRLEPQQYGESFRQIRIDANLEDVECDALFCVNKAFDIFKVVPNGVNYAGPTKGLPLCVQCIELMRRIGLKNMRWKTYSIAHPSQRKKFYKRVEPQWN